MLNLLILQKLISPPSTLSMTDKMQLANLYYLNNNKIILFNCINIG